MAANSTILPKPVMRLTRVAKAIAPEWWTTAAAGRAEARGAKAFPHGRGTPGGSDSSGRRRDSSGTGGSGPVGGEPCCLDGGPAGRCGRGGGRRAGGGGAGGGGR